MHNFCAELLWGAFLLTFSVGRNRFCGVSLNFCGPFLWNRSVELFCSPFSMKLSVFVQFFRLTFFHFLLSLFCLSFLQSFSAELFLRVVLCIFAATYTIAPSSLTIGWRGRITLDGCLHICFLDLSLSPKHKARFDRRDGIRL